MRNPAMGTAASPRRAAALVQAIAVLALADSVSLAGLADEADAEAERPGCSSEEMRQQMLAATTSVRLKPLLLRSLYPNCPQAQLDSIPLTSEEDELMAAAARGEGEDADEAAEEADAAAPAAPYRFRPRPYGERGGGGPDLVPLAGDRAETPRRARGCRALLYVAVSPLRAGRLAELFWDYENCPVQPAAAAIYPDGEQAFHNVAELAPAPVWRANITGGRGRVVTAFAVPRALPEGWARRRAGGGGTAAGPRPAGEFCRPFRAVLLDAEGTHLQTACLMLRPSWMQQLVTFGKGTLPLQDMLLPGTHNSGSFPRDGEDGDSQVARFVLTQEYSVWEQLVSGVRYLDLRVGFYPDNMGDQQEPGHPDHNQTFWVNHDVARVRPLRPLLEDVKEFVTDEQRRSDIVILHFHRFPVGFGAAEGDKDAELQRHRQLFDLLREVFGELLIKNDPTFSQKTLKEIFSTGGKVLISYGHSDFQKRESELLHPPIPQQWGNKQSLADLVGYIERKLQQRRDSRSAVGAGLAACMAELTPTAMNVLLNMQRYSLRNLANAVNENITEKCREELWYNNANIVAVDFVESTDLVSVALAANWRMATHREEERRLLELEAAAPRRGWNVDSPPPPSSAPPGPPGPPGPP